MQRTVEILRRMLDISPWLHRRFDDCRLYGNPVTDLRVDCFKCGDAGGHLHVSIIKHTCHCFRCGYSASWIRLVMDVDKVSYYKAVGELYEKPKISEWAKVTYDDIDIASRGVDFHSDSIALPKDFIMLRDTLSGYEYEKLYLRKRGFSSDYWIRYNLGVSDTYENRIIIPIELGYWQGRAIWSWMMPKYVNPKSMSRHYIFNSVALMYDEVVICEGAFSAMAIGHNAIALLGKEASKEKLDRLIMSNVSRFVITVEPDAMKHMLRLADVLHNNGKQVVLWIYKKGDPADTDLHIDLRYDFHSKVRLLLDI